MMIGSMTIGNIIIGQKEYKIRRLSGENVIEVQSLCERCSDFSELTEGRPPEACAGNDILFDLPLGKELKDKYVFGVFNEKDVLIAVIDLVKDYKVIGEWIIGLLMIDPSERGNGLGRKIHELIMNWVSKEKGRKLRIGVVEENYRGYQFWREMGYFEIDRVKSTYGNKEHTVIVMNVLINE